MLTATLSSLPETTAVLVRVCGRWDGAGATVFEEQLKALPAAATVCVVEATGVDYLSSAGIRSLLRLEKTLLARGGGTILAGLTPGVTQVLEMSGLLKQLHTAPSVEAAMALARQRAAGAAASVSRTLGSCRYELRSPAVGPSHLELWGRLATPAAGDTLETATLAELGCAFGVAGIGQSRDQAIGGMGRFVAAANVLITQSEAVGAAPDYLQVADPSQAVCHMAWAAGLGGPARFEVSVTCDASVDLKQIAADLLALVAELTGSDVRLAGLVGAFETGGPEPEQLFGVATICGADGPAALTGDAASWAVTPGLRLCGHAAVIAGAAAPAAAADPVDWLVTALAAEGEVRRVIELDAELPVHRAEFRLYLPVGSCPGRAKQIQINPGTGEDLRPEWEVILRRIYAGVARVDLERLTGGFSSTTYRVTTFDRDGRRMLPTVVKFGSVALTRREEARYREFVERFILNNSTTILGVDQQGEWAGLCYNFLGITGPNSRLRWLTDLYRERPAEELLPLFDRIFTGVLKPWYGQPKWERIQPYRDHDPRAVFFPKILEDAEREFGISADNPEFDCHELGLTLPNPFHFLKHEYPVRATRYTPLWYTGVTHGDLNMQNILVDECENLYVIDFSETRVRNIVADFARLEPILKFEMTRLETEEDLVRLLEFEATFHEARTLTTPPPFRYRGTDPMVAKAHRLICRLREYADTVTLFETDLAPYLLAVLEWTYPVVSYWTAARLRKRAAICSAALICRLLKELQGD